MVEVKKKHVIFPFQLRMMVLVSVSLLFYVHTFIVSLCVVSLDG